jgi:hypothetical protein
VSEGTDVIEVLAAKQRREARSWRLLVGMQATVIAAILLSILLIFLVGLFAGIFVQRSL